MRWLRGIAGAAVACWLALSASAPARAQDCAAFCSQYRNGECVEFKHNCMKPVESAPAAPVPTSSYGAIALGGSGRTWGESFKWGSRAKAETAALQNCARNDQGCTVKVWFEKQCGAVVSEQGAAIFWGVGDSDDAARADARSKCAGGGGTECAVQVSQCSK